MNTEVTIRRAVAADFDTVYGFLTQLEDTAFDRKKLRSIFEENISFQYHIYLVAVINNVVVGYLSCHTQQLLHHGGWVGEIQELYVIPEKRSLGVGTLLMDHVKKEASEGGILQLEVTANNHRLQAHRFYVQEGFTQTHQKFVHPLSGDR